MQQLLLRVGLPVAGIALMALAWQRFGWQGIVVVVTALVLWLMLHFNRTMQVLRRAADRPLGYVDSAVMLNAKLKPGVTLLHVVAMTRSLGQLQTVKDAQPEVYRWRDNGDSYVDATFLGGRLTVWELVRPTQPPDAAAVDATATKIAGSGSAER
ncbi:MAG: glycerate kinase [Burkholderiaceae bacterium]